MEQNPRGIATLGPIVLILLWCGLAVNIAELLSELAYLATGNLTFVAPDVSLIDAIQTGGFFLLILTFFVFGRWLWVASKNLWDEGHVLEYSPASNIWWYAVPFANLFKPFGAMRELWAYSLGKTETNLTEAPIHMKWWWGGYIVSTIAQNIGARLTATEPMVILYAVSAAASLLWYWFAIRLVREITAGQKQGISSLTHIFA